MGSGKSLTPLTWAMCWGTAILCVIIAIILMTLRINANIVAQIFIFSFIALFALEFTYIIKKKKKKAEKIAQKAPNAYVCVDCDIYKEITIYNPKTVFDHVINCPQCGKVMMPKRLDKLGSPKVEISF